MADKYVGEIVTHSRSQHDSRLLLVALPGERRVAEGGDALCLSEKCESTGYELERRSWKYWRAKRPPLWRTTVYRDLMPKIKWRCEGIGGKEKEF